MHVPIRSAALALLLAACGSPGAVTQPGADSTVSGPDATTPYPIDRGGSSPSAPGSYKSLPLRLVDNAEPAVAGIEGRIGFVCIGMSNANQECADFQRRFTGEYATSINPAVRFVNCAVGGNAIEKWIDPANDATLWRRCIDQLLPAAGLRVDQVRIIWHKAADQFTTGTDGKPLPLYPAASSDYGAFIRNLTAFSKRVKAFFPAAEAVYTTSRSYGGFGSADRGEPLSYEEGLSLNSWLRSNPSVDGVWYGWGPYIWAPDCATGITNGSGVCYNRADYGADGVHPSASGQAKVSAQLHTRLLTQRWYRKP